MNTFEDVEQPLQPDDLRAVEQEIGQVLPEAFKRHYLRCNGGTPEKAFFPGDDEWEPLEVAGFFPIRYHRDDPGLRRALIEGRYAYLLEKQVIPASLLPFANDHGGNFFCLDLHTGAVCFYATDAFDPDLPMADNHAQASRVLCQDFQAFLDALTTEDEACG